MRGARICLALVSVAVVVTTGRAARADAPPCSTATTCVEVIATADDQDDVTAAYLRLYAAGPDARRAALEAAKKARDLADVDANKKTLKDAQKALDDAGIAVGKAKDGVSQANTEYEQVKSDSAKEPAAGAKLKEAQAKLTSEEASAVKAKLQFIAAQRRDAFGEVIAKLEVFNQNDAAARQKLFNDNACAKRLILCLDRDGAQLNDEETHPTLLVGDQVAVLVFSNAASDEKQNFAVAMSGVLAYDRTLGNGGASGAQSGRSIRPEVVEIDRARTRTDPPKAPPYGLVHKTVSAEVTADIERIHLVFQRKTPDDEYETKIDLNVQRGTYHLEINVAGAFVPWGARTVNPSGRIETDTDVTATFGFTWYFDKRVDGTLVYPKGASAFGLSFATDFNFTISPVDKNWYAGAVYSPLQGLGFAAGVALVHGQFRTASIDTPDLIGETAHFQRRAMLRPYVAVVLTPELFGSLLSASNRTRKQFADAQTADASTPRPATGGGN